MHCAVASAGVVLGYPESGGQQCGNGGCQQRGGGSSRYGAPGGYGRFKLAPCLPNDKNAHDHDKPVAAFVRNPLQQSRSFTDSTMLFFRNDKPRIASCTPRARRLTYSAFACTSPRPADAPKSTCSILLRSSRVCTSFRSDVASLKRMLFV